MTTTRTTTTTITTTTTPPVGPKKALVEPFFCHLVYSVFVFVWFWVFGTTEGTTV